MGAAGHGGAAGDFGHPPRETPRGRFPPQAPGITGRAPRGCRPAGPCCREEQGSVLFFPSQTSVLRPRGGKGRQQASVPSSPAVGKGLCVAKGRERCLWGSFPLQTGSGSPLGRRHLSNRGKIHPWHMSNENVCFVWGPHGNRNEVHNCSKMRAPWGSPHSTQMQQSLEGPPATHVKKKTKKEEEKCHLWHVAHLRAVHSFFWLEIPLRIRCGVQRRAGTTCSP